ncbi:MAG: IMPACT family protein [Bilophila wadsworthia]
MARRSRFIVSLAIRRPEAANPSSMDQTGIPDATHNCWAYAAGAPGQTSKVGYSDDGEPHGTAGRPMLTMLLHGGVGELSAVVTRYFGGIKLGTGGLVRAYQGMVKLGLETLPTREHMIPARVEVVLDIRITVSPPAGPGHRRPENFGVTPPTNCCFPDQNIRPRNRADGTHAVLITRLTAPCH